MDKPKLLPDPELEKQLKKYAASKELNKRVEDCMVDEFSEEEDDVVVFSEELGILEIEIDEDDDE